MNETDNAIDLKVAAVVSAICLSVGWAVNWHLDYGGPHGIVDDIAMLPWIVPTLVPCLAKRRMKRRRTGFLVAGVCTFLTYVLVHGGDIVIHQTGPHYDRMDIPTYWLVVETLLVGFVLGGLANVLDSSLAFALRRLGIEHEAHPLFHLLVRAAGMLVVWLSFVYFVI